MYYRKKRHNLIDWLKGPHTKIYLVILLILGVIAALIYNNFDYIVSSFNNMAEPDNTGVDVNQTSVHTETPTIIIDAKEKYIIKINIAENYIDVYETIAENGNTKQNPLYSFKCSISSKVIAGDFNVSEKSIWRKIDNGQYGQYTTRIAANCYIHSVPYYSEDNTNLIVDAYNQLGKASTYGYISLASSDAKWIYENCINGTKVEIYSEKGKQPAISIKESSTLSNGTTFDPTDIKTAGVPVNTKIDYMTGVKDATITTGSTFNKWEGIYAVDMNGTDITSHITITGDIVDTNTPGVYTLIYNLSDTQGTNLAYYRYITVK